MQAQKTGELKRWTLLPIAACLLTLAGCTTTKNSDTLNLTNESDKLLTYAQSYEPARLMLAQGKFSELRDRLKLNEVDDKGQPLTNEDEKDRLLQTSSELALVERALLALNTGDPIRSLFYFDIADEKMGWNDDKTTSEKASSVAKTTLANLLGTEELSNYDMRGYEKVMLSNYKSLCYLLQGNRRAYNVARSAIDRQQLEWEKFEDMLAKVKAEQAKQNSQTLDFSSKDSKKQALSVSSAYVNPFADFVNGMILELDATMLPDQLSKAKIAYEKAYKNNPQCKPAKEAINDINAALKANRQSTIGSNQKFVFVIFADGFAPSREEKTEKIKLDKQTLQINIPQLVSYKTPVKYAVAYVNKQAKPLSSLTKMEAMVYRDELDRLPITSLKLLMGLTRSAVGAAFLGDLGVNLMSTIQHPDTRSWLTLPNVIDVARLKVPASTKSIQIVTYNDKKRPIAKKTVELAPKGPTIIYAVNYFDQLQTFANKTSWLVDPSLAH